MGKVWYLGTDPSRFVCQGELLHYPMIQIVPRNISDPHLKRAYDDLDQYTHLIFTSRNGVFVFFKHLEALSYDVKRLSGKEVIAVGKATAECLDAKGLCATQVAQEEKQEGIVAMLNQRFLENAYCFLPRSSISRPLLENYLRQRQIRFQTADLYDTKTHAAAPPCPLEEVSEIVFTSPSTVRAFVETFGALPQDKVLTPIGSITESALQEYF